MFGLFEDREFSSNSGTNVVEGLADIVGECSIVGGDKTHQQNSENPKHTLGFETFQLEENLLFGKAEKREEIVENNNNRREMVAQDMAQSYNQLFHAARESQDFISLDDLGPHMHHQPVDHQRQGITTCSVASSHIYLDDRDNEQQVQQRTYYNLAVLSNEIQSGNLGIHSDGALAPSSACTPASSVSSVATAESSGAGRAIGGGGGRRSASSTKVTENNAPSSPTEKRNSSGMHISQQPAASYRSHHNHHRNHHRNYQRKTPARDPADNYFPVSRKRKASFQDENDSLDDGADDTKSVRTNTDSKKQNHSEIEKRRRDKMNTYITELSVMVPMCHAMSRKLDKLTVLRMAVQHLKTILGAVSSYTGGHYKPAFLSDQELKTLILQIFDAAQAAEGFVFVVGCDRGRILYVSESVSQTLNYSQEDLLGQSWFDILHPKDVAKVKEQLSSSDLSPRERLIDAKTMLPVKTDVPQGVSRLCPGARRSFFCRMKRKVDTLASSGETQVKEEADTTTGCHRRKKQQNADWKYCVIQCTGYLKSWAPAKIGMDQEHENEGLDGDACNLSCLVAVGRVQPGLLALSPGETTPRLRTIEFVSRHAIDGKFIFVDQRATLVLGFLPQELLGTSMYEYYHHDDIAHLAESHKAALQTPESVKTQVYRFRTKGASFIRLQSEWKSFRNPWTKDIEYLIAKNSAVFNDSRQLESSAEHRSEGSSVQGNYDYFTQSNGGLEKLISSHVEVSKIGRRIAEEVLDQQRRGEDSSSGDSPNPIPDQIMRNPEITTNTTSSTSNVTTSSERVLHQSTVGSDNSSSNPTSTFSHIRNNVSLNSIANEQVSCGDKFFKREFTHPGGAPPEEDMIEIIGGAAINESSTPLPSDGNDEAAMAVIMSLLEADAGLGGPVDFSGLPWPLP